MSLLAQPSLLLCLHSIGDNIRLLVDRPDGRYCFRFHRDRVYYVRCVVLQLVFVRDFPFSTLTIVRREDVMRHATSVARENLISLGICFGKFTRGGKFTLQITALTYLAPYAKVVSLWGECHSLDL